MLRWLHLISAFLPGPSAASPAHVVLICGPCAMCSLPPCSKTLIGDYLGERDDFNLKVMHSYVDALDFTEMEFDGAIRWGGWGRQGAGQVLRWMP